MLQTLWAVTETNLTDIERDELAQHEAVIERGLKTFVDVGLALLAIRDGRLYREVFGTFEDYCHIRWGLKRQRAYELMGAATVVSNLSEISDKLPDRESHAAPMVSLPVDMQREVWRVAVETAPDGKLTGSHVQRVVDELTGEVLEERPAPRPEVVHVSDDSYEWYTPASYIVAARQVLGGIDLDPASCAEANENVQAGRYYTKEEDGLDQPWFGRVFLNPPYNMPWVEKFTQKAIEAYEAGEIDACIVLVNNATDTGWFHALMEKYPICFTRRRVQFWNPEGPSLGTRQGQAFFYLGDYPEKFAQVFSQFGIVVKRYDD